MARRPLAYGIAGAGLLTTLTAMAALHPYEHLYFNALVDTKTPGAIAKRYEMDYWAQAERQPLEYLLARHPRDTLRVWQESDRVLLTLPQEDRDRLINLKNPHALDFYLLGDRRGRPLFGKPEIVERYYLHPLIDLSGNIADQPPLHSIRAYGSDLMHIIAKNVEPYRAAYADVVANGEPLARSDFDIYAYDGALYYLNADCPPPAPNRPNFQIFLHIIPADLADLPVDGREFGFENRDFGINNRAAFFDGKCIIRQHLPEYAIARITTGVYMKGELIWRADINLAVRAAASVVYDSVLAGDYGVPVAQSDFDLYLRDNILTYLKEPCSPGDTDARFLLHIFPVDSADLPTVWREYGFGNMDFHFADHGAHADGICVATRDLPDYPIERIRTGQFASGEGNLWSVEFAAGR